MTQLICQQCGGLIDMMADEKVGILYGQGETCCQTKEGSKQE